MNNLLFLQAVCPIITVNYSKSFAEMITVGNYDWVHPIVTPDKFLIMGEGICQFEPKLFHFDRKVYFEEAISLIEREDVENPWEPVSVEPFLSYGAASPNGRCYPTVGLHSSAMAHGDYFVLSLVDGDYHNLDILWLRDGFDRECRFLAVRPVK